jgi:hypothetical protein
MAEEGLGRAPPPCVHRSETSEDSGNVVDFIVGS